MRKKDDIVNWMEGNYVENVPIVDEGGYDCLSSDDFIEYIDDLEDISIEELAKGEESDTFVRVLSTEAYENIKCFMKVHYYSKRYRYWGHFEFGYWEY